MKQAENTPHNWSEDKLQAEIVRWFRNEFPDLRGCLFSVPNGAAKSGMMAKLFKATGLLAGVSDLLFMINKTTYCMELKRPDGKGGQSPTQKKWQLQMKAQGFEYTLFNDLLELKKYLLNRIVFHHKVDKGNYPHKQLKMF